MIGENYSNVANSGSSVTEHIAWAQQLQIIHFTEPSNA